MPPPQRVFKVWEHVTGLKMTFYGTTISSNLEYLMNVTDLILYQFNVKYDSGINIRSIKGYHNTVIMLLHLYA